MPNPLQDDILKMGGDSLDDSFLDLKVFKYKIGEMEKVFVGSHRKWQDILSEMNKKYNIDKLAENTKAIEKEIAARREALKEMHGEEAEETKRIIKEKERLYKKAYENESEERTRAAEQTTQILDVYEKNLYKNSDIRQKASIAQRRKDAIDSTKAELSAMQELELAEAPLEEHAKIRAKYAEQINALSEEEVKNNERLEKLSKARLKARDEIAKKTRTASWAERREMILDAKHEDTQEKRKKLEDVYTARQLALDEASTDEERSSVIQKFAEEIAKAENDVEKAEGDEREARRGVALAKAVSKTLTNVLKSNLDAVEKGIDAIKGLQSSIKTRLQGAETNYEDILDLLSKNLAVSPYVQYQKTLENLSKLVDSGIAYNVEERAFLATISDKIATTFDAFDSSLMRIIRLQQADTTASRMAMEASLTKFLNNMFSDTSYLSNMYDTVQNAILDASAALSYKESTAFEYILQKWLGSLYSLGFSDTAVSNIASGINMLATGNTKLVENQPLTTLLAMSASRSGEIDFADALVNGIDSSQLNVLMKSMVQYLREIAENSDTNVIKSAYGDIFDISFSDWNAIMNLTNQDVENISKSVMSYEDSMKELSSQLGQISERLSASEMISNIFSNLSFAQSANIANNPALYALWEVANFIQSATGGIQFPNPGVLGNFLDLTAFTVEGIMKLGLIGTSTLIMIPQIVSSFENRGGLGNEDSDIFETWRATQRTARGTGINLYSPVSKGTSASMEYVGTQSSDEYKTASLTQMMEEAEEQQKITNPEAQATKTFNDLFEALFGTTTGSGQQKMLVKIDQLGDFTHEINSAVFVAQESNSWLTNEASTLISQTNADKALRVWLVGSDVEIGSSSSASPFSNSSPLESSAVITYDDLSRLLSFKEGDTEYTIADLIRKIMNGDIESKVTVTNDNFDTFLQRNVFIQ